MKKVLVSLCAMCAVFAITSCRSAKEIISLSALNGEWNIVEINGATVVPEAGRELPYIGFDTSAGTVYGNSGCNRMTGSFSRNVKPGVLTLGTIAGTRMMCTDMTTEQNVLNALKNVQGFKRVSANRMALTNSRNRPVMVLAPKVATSSLISALEGEWRIAEIKGVAIPTDLQNVPFISFDLKTKRIHGNAGCNMMNSGMITDDNNPRSLSFPAIATTMMACPSMDVERKVLDALNDVKSFEVFVDKTVGLYGANGTQLALLRRK